MPLHLPLSDPRNPQHKWRKLTVKPWAELDAQRVRRFHHLLVRLHNDLGAGWDVRQEEGRYAVTRHDDAAILAVVAPWKEMELVVGFRADLAGAYDAAKELSPSVLGLHLAAPPERYYAAAVPDRGQEDEILLTTRAFLHALATPPHESAIT